MSHARDLYSLGRLIQYAIFGPDDFKHPIKMTERVPQLGTVEKKLFTLSEQLTQTQPANRPAVHEIIQALEGIQKDEEQMTDVKNRIEKSSERPEGFSQAA